MNDWVASILLVVGSTFMLVAAIGAVKLPDLYLRMHAAAKAGTLGKICLLLAVVTQFFEFGVVSRVILIILFFFMTAPVGAQMLSRIAFRTGVRPTPQTRSLDSEGIVSRMGDKAN